MFSRKLFVQGSFCALINLILFWILYSYDLPVWFCFFFVFVASVIEGYIIVLKRKGDF